MSKRVAIIGAGIGGIATAALLAKLGFDVTVYESAAQPGGRAGRLTIDGFTFDTGPSWYLMPKVFDHFYQLLGTSTGSELTLQKLSPAYKVFFENQPPITITGDIAKDSQTFELIERGAGSSLHEYVEHSTTLYELALKHFLYTNFNRPSELLHPDILKRVFQLPRLLGSSIDSHVSRFVTDDRLKKILEYPMVFLGSSPYEAPALYSLMSALDFSEGVYYPAGGMYTIIQSLVRLAENSGVRFVYGQPVTKIMVHDHRAAGIVTGNESRPADIVISNADLPYTEMSLLEAEARSYPDSYWKNRQPSPSALLLYVGVSGKIPEFSHHTLLFNDDWRHTFTALYQTGAVPHPVSMYIGTASKSDTTVAPAGHENVFILVPLPAGVTLSPAAQEKLINRCLDQVKTMTGVDLAGRLVSKKVFGPDDFRTRFHAWSQTMLGPSHTLKQSAFFRTPNKSTRLKNLYYVGAGTVPGIGVPMCLISAELVTKRIMGYAKGGQVLNLDAFQGRTT